MNKENVFGVSTRTQPRIRHHLQDGSLGLPLFLGVGCLSFCLQDGSLAPGLGGKDHIGLQTLGFDGLSEVLKFDLGIGSGLGCIALCPFEGCEHIGFESAFELSEPVCLSDDGLFGDLDGHVADLSGGSLSLKCLRACVGLGDFGVADDLSDA